MARKFVNAGLVQQNSMGHCSLSATSKCTIGKIKKYFQKGEVPPHPESPGNRLGDGNWDKCEADEWPFHIYKGAEESQMEAESMKAMQGLQKVFQNFHLASAHGYGLVPPRFF